MADRARLSGACGDSGSTRGWKLTCAEHVNHALHMSVTIQIRNVPGQLHRRLKARAALSGMSLSDYLLDEISRVAERPTVEELSARLESRSAISLDISPADAVRAERSVDRRRRLGGPRKPPSDTRGGSG